MEMSDFEKANNLYDIEGLLTEEDGLEWFLERWDRKEYDRIKNSKYYKDREGTDVSIRL